MDTGGFPSRSTSWCLSRWLSGPEASVLGPVPQTAVTGLTLQVRLHRQPGQWCLDSSNRLLEKSLFIYLFLQSPAQLWPMVALGVEPGPSERQAGSFAESCAASLPRIVLRGPGGDAGLSRTRGFLSLGERWALPAVTGGPLAWQRRWPALLCQGLVPAQLLCTGLRPFFPPFASFLPLSFLLTQK